MHSECRLTMFKLSSPLYEEPETDAVVVPYWNVLCVFGWFSGWSRGWVGGSVVG